LITLKSNGAQVRKGFFQSCAHGVSQKAGRPSSIGQPCLIRMAFVMNVLKKSNENSMLHLTKHFKERWEERVGGAAPEPEDVETMIADAIELQKFRNAYTPRGRRLTILALYWVPERGVVVKVNEKTRQAVTVVTEADFIEKRGGAI